MKRSVPSVNATNANLNLHIVDLCLFTCILACLFFLRLKLTEILMIELYDLGKVDETTLVFGSKGIEKNYFASFFKLLLH